MGAAAAARYRTMNLPIAGSAADWGYMNIAVFGLGYVGVVSAACLARDGHNVLGVDPNTLKIEILQRGRSPIIEPGLDELIAPAVASGRLVAGADYAAAVE